MSYDIKITSKGQITLPKKIRTELALKTGGYLRAEIKNGKIILNPISSRADNTVLKEYAESEGRKSIGLAKVRALTEQIPNGMGNYVRKIREEEANED